jgi:glutamine synthetase
MPIVRIRSYQASLGAFGEMREAGGMKHIEDAIKRLEIKHLDHIAVYGEGNEERLSGKHETGHIGAFSWGVADRGASIRVPRHVAAQGFGYLEDRRPASNIDPYQVTGIMCETTLL